VTITDDDSRVAAERAEQRATALLRSNPISLDKGGRILSRIVAPLMTRISHFLKGGPIEKGLEFPCPVF
jgi:hypothetical protein